MVACRVSRPRISGLWRRIHFVKLKTLEFLDLASEYFRAQINVISGPEEARLIFQAVAHTQSTEGRFLVFDLGGGSTEFAVGVNFETEFLSPEVCGKNWTVRVRSS